MTCHKKILRRKMIFIAYLLIFIYLSKTNLYINKLQFSTQDNHQSFHINPFQIYSIIPSSRLVFRFEKVFIIFCLCASKSRILLYFSKIYKNKSSFYKIIKTILEKVTRETPPISFITYVCPVIH